MHRCLARFYYPGGTGNRLGRPDLHIQYHLNRVFLVQFGGGQQIKLLTIHVGLLHNTRENKYRAEQHYPFNLIFSCFLLADAGAGAVDYTLINNFPGDLVIS